jgi:hypothetical protein
MKTLLRRALSVVAAAALVGGLSVATAVTADASTHGGGCLNPRALYGDVSYAPCISIDSSGRIAYDAYLGFFSPVPNLIKTCTVVENIRDDTVRNTIAQSAKDCTAAFRSSAKNFRAGPFFRFQNGNGHAYHNYMWVYVAYQSGYNYTTAVANSPEQYT